MKHLSAIFCALLLVLAACSQPTTTTPVASRITQPNWPAMTRFAAVRTGSAVAQPNTRIARDFLDLSFNLESGESLPVFTRFEGPISIAFAHKVPSYMSRDLDVLLTRLRQEAGINIQRASQGSAARIVIETLPAKTMHKRVPSAACFIVPNVNSWQEFLKNRASGAINWRNVKQRHKVLVIMPLDTAPQEARDCLHEEIAQALGPLNDLYRLTGTVFNDDNFQLTLGALDMLVLRLTHAPEFRSGMSRSEVAQRLPAVLNRLNPAGRRPETRRINPTSQRWKAEIETALGPRTSSARRISAASRAISLAQSAGYNDHRLGYAYFARGRVGLFKQTNQATNDFVTAYNLFTKNPGPRSAHAASAAVQLASWHISSGKFASALALIDASLPAARHAQDAQLMFSLLALKAVTLDARAHPDQAQSLKSQAIGWGRYGFGSDAEIEARLLEISKLSPLKAPDLSQGS